MLCGQAAAAGAARVRGECQPIARAADRWRVGGVEARVLVDAAGRHGLRIDGPCQREFDDRLLALIFRAARPGNLPHDRRMFIEAAPAGWWCSAPLPEGQATAMLFTDCALYRREGIVPEEQLHAAPLTRGQLRDAELCGPRAVYVSSSCRWRIAGEAWLAAGDSASCYDPLAGRGIFKALRQGGRAAEAVDAYLAGGADALERYAAGVRAEFDAYAPQRRLYYASETRWSGQTFWRGRVYTARRSR
jgi:hypothetical protein